mmetsp:Transcript_2730/g.7627  ORF Transcript_2730/g.7627 Transcript_2730/m.7627 type:complete len:202 (+) Transcript_2730:1113-1718(+)
MTSVYIHDMGTKSVCLRGRPGVKHNKIVRISKPLQHASLLIVKSGSSRHSPPFTSSDNCISHLHYCIYGIVRIIHSNSTAQDFRLIWAPGTLVKVPKIMKTWRMCNASNGVRELPQTISATCSNPIIDVFPWYSGGSCLQLHASQIIGSKRQLFNNEIKCGAFSILYIIHQSPHILLERRAHCNVAIIRYRRKQWAQLRNT